MSIFCDPETDVAPSEAVENMDGRGITDRLLARIPKLGVQFQKHAAMPFILGQGGPQVGGD